MIRLSPGANQQLSALLHHYRDIERPEAARNLIVAIDKAAAQIERNPSGGLPAPRPYPDLARPGRAWIKVGRYWIAYGTNPRVILNVFYDQADIRGRL